jgi:hydroxymethylpyrimidine pyrophosphatase-like HAD family hydrolase
MPKSTSKANAVMKLKKHLNAQKVVVFGYGRNDIDMFKVADESYAVKNAVDDLKNIATGVIDMNDNDAVAKWLKENIGVIS